MQSSSASNQPTEDAGDFTVVQYKKNLRTNTQRANPKGAQLKANKEEPPASRHGSQLKEAPPQTKLGAPQPVPPQDDQLEDCARPPELSQQPELQESQRTSAASGSSPQSQQHLQGPAEPPQAVQQPETQPSSAAAGASEPAQKPRPAGATPGHQRYWREPWQACYYTHQQKVAMGLQLFRPVPHPRGGRPGGGGGMSLHPSWQLHFTTWEVGCSPSCISSHTHTCISLCLCTGLLKTRWWQVCVSTLSVLLKPPTYTGLEQAIPVLGTAATRMKRQSPVTSLGERLCAITLMGESVSHGQHCLRTSLLRRCNAAVWIQSAMRSLLSGGKCMQVQRAFVDARRDGHAGRYAEAREKMLKVHELESWNTRIIVDLAELCVALESFEQAVSCWRPAMHAHRDRHVHYMARVHVVKGSPC